MTLGQVPSLLKETVIQWRRHKASRLAAALAYYALFSLAPVLVVAVYVAGRVYGPEDSLRQLTDQLTRVLGKDAAETVRAMVANVSRRQGAGLITTLVGIATLLLGAAGVFRNLKDALNTAWEVQPRDDGGGYRGMAWGFARSQLLAVSMVLATGILLLVSLVAGSVVTALARVASAYLPVSTTLLQLADLGLFFVLFALLFALTFRVLPERDISWGDVWIGATVTSLLFTLGRFLISLYLSVAGPTSLKGAAGSVLVLLLWVYYSAQIYLLGAELTHVYATRFRAKPPADTSPEPAG